MTQSNISNAPSPIKPFLNLQIYVACLASYNNGVLYGRWIDAAQDEEIICEEINEMLSRSPSPGAEEYAIHDFEDFGCFLDEYASIAEVHEIALFIKEHGELGVGLLEYIGDIESSKNAMENNYHGEYKSELDFAQCIFDDYYLNEIPTSLQYYIDYEAFSRDIFVNDYYSIVIAGDFHIFSSN